MQFRPHFSELCNCVNVMLSTSQSHFYDGAKSEGRRATTEAAYNGGADYFYDVDCKDCDGTGVTTTQLAA